MRFLILYYEDGMKSYLNLDLVLGLSVSKDNKIEVVLGKNGPQTDLVENLVKWELI